MSTIITRLYSPIIMALKERGRMSLRELHSDLGRNLIVRPRLAEVKQAALVLESGRLIRMERVGGRYVFSFPGVQ